MRFLAKRLGFYLVAFWVAISLNFLIPRIMPGDPATMLFISLQGKMSRDALNELKKAYGFEGSLWHQYFVYLKKLSVGDLGVSTVNFPQPVVKSLLYATSWTLYLVGTSTFLSFVIGTIMGMYAAWGRGKFFDSFFTPFNVICTAFSPPVVALLLFYGFAFKLNLFPIGRAYALEADPAFTWTFISNFLHHSILPIISILIVFIGGWHLGMRNNMINLLNEDFILLARAKGLSENRVMFKYAARNALLPIITQLAMTIGYIFAGAIFTEVVFNYPGLGKFTLTAIQYRDYAFIQGQMLFITGTVLLANLISDFVNVLLDPRLRRAGVHE